MLRFVAASILLASSVVAADPVRTTVGNGYDLVSEDYKGTFVVRGKQRARISPNMLDTAKVDTAGKKVDATLLDVCEASHQESWTFGHLEARIENTAAYALHKKKDYKGSAAGFAKAVAADPTWKIPAYNLASAQQLLGDKDGAIKTLSPWLTSEPLTTYVKIASDPELSPLLDRAELKALRAPKPGNAKLTQDAGVIAYQPDQKLLAVARTEGSWGACFYETDLEIYDATGKLVATTPIVEWNETSSECDEKSSGVLPKARKTVAKRVTALQTVLRDLGFKKVATEAGTDLQWDDDKQKSSMRKAKLGVVIVDGVVRVFRKNTELGSGGVLTQVGSIEYVPDMNAVVIYSLRPGSEGCEGTDPTMVTIVPLKSK